MTKLEHQLLNELRQFTGDMERFRSLSPKLIYTPGVQYLAQEAECGWLIDAISSYIPSNLLQRAIRKDERVETLHFWNLTVRDNQSAVLTACVDSGEPPFITQEMEFTDFPLPTIDLWCGYDGMHWTLYLPSEH